MAVNTIVPGSLETLIADMLAKAPADRPSSMQAIEAIFDQMLQAGNEPTQPPYHLGAETVTQPSSPDKTDMIAPVKVVPTDERKPSTQKISGNLVKGVALLVALIALLAGGLSLWRYLGGQHRKPAVAEAENKLAELMQLKETLEAKGVSKWGAETYQDMSQFADEADRLLIENEYAQAADRYAAAIEKARQLVDKY